MPPAVALKVTEPVALTVVTVKQEASVTSTEVGDAYVRAEGTVISGFVTVALAAKSAFCDESRVRAVVLLV